MSVGFRSYRFAWMAVAVLMFAAPAFAQGEAIVQGQLRTSADGAALPGAMITLDAGARSQPRQVMTDGEGRFVFARVPPGEYVVSAALAGFDRRSVRVAIEPREVRTITLSLDVGRVNVSVNVAAEPSTLTSTHSPSSTMLTSERLDALPVFQRLSLPDAIVTSAPGMIRGHDDFVHIRGHEIALNPVINGVSFWENTHAAFSAGLSPEIVETANVMTGGFPAEYGNRFGGVVDVVTKSGLRMTERGSVAFSGGNAKRRHLAADVGGRLAAFGYYLFGDTFESDRFLSPPDPQANHDSARGGHLFARLDTNRQRAGSFSAIVMADGTNLQIPNTPVDVALRPLAQANQRTRQQTATFGWTRAWSDSTVVNASTYERWSRLRLLPAAGPLTAEADLTRELTTIGGKVDLTRLSGRHTFKFGVDAVNLRPDEDLFYSYDGYRALAHVLELPHIHISGQTIQFSGSDSGGQVSAYVQDNLELGSRITLDAGLRLDRYNLVIDDTHLSPRLNLALRAGGHAVLHASYNHFFVPPAVEGVLSSSAGLTSKISEIGFALPALRPTVENQFEAGGSAPVGPVHLAFTGYFRGTDNPVHTTVWPDSRLYSYASFDRARAYGLEAKAELVGMQKHGVSGYLNYALGRVNFYNPVTGGFISEAAHLTESDRFPAPMDQTHTLTAGATWRHARSGVLAGLTMEYGSGTPIGHGGGAHEHGAGEADHADAEAGEGSRVPGHFMAGVSLGIDLLRDPGRRSRLSLRLDVENMANKVYVIAQDSAFSPAQFSIPRLLTLTARIQF
jgi:hypothetical protein